MTLPVGAQVTLLSGGPVMTVGPYALDWGDQNETREEDVFCYWFDTTGALHMGSLPLAILRECRTGSTATPGSWG